MTAVNIVRTADRLHVITDGLGDHPDGRHMAVSKQVAMPHLGMIIATRGRRAIVNEIVDVLSECESYEAAHAQLGVLLKGRWPSLEQRARELAKVWGLSEAEFLAAEIYVAAVSAAGDFSVFALVTHTAYGDALRPFEALDDVPDFYISPSPSDVVAKFAAGSITDEEIERKAVEIISAQRDSTEATRSVDGTPRTLKDYIGGHVDVGTISRDGRIELRTVHRYR